MATGPIKIRASGTMMSSVQKGTRKVRTTLGMNFLKKPSILPPTYVERIIGMTLDA
ncbi:hypothetical protein D3C80_2172340 [compost metagenome]